MSTLQPDYLPTLLRYYEEEIEGEAMFAALAQRQEAPEYRVRMQLLADVETHAAAAVAPLLEKYRLTPQDSAALHATGRAQAAAAPGDWATLIAEMRRTFPAYIDDFERLEALAPAEDLPLLKVLTDHEHAAIEFLERETQGDPDSTAPLRRYMDTGRA